MGRSFRSLRVRCGLLPVPLTCAASCASQIKALPPPRRVIGPHRGHHTRLRSPQLSHRSRRSRSTMRALLGKPANASSDNSTWRLQAHSTLTRSMCSSGTRRESIPTFVICKEF